MGTQAGFDPNAFGPFGASFQSYFSAIDSFSPREPSTDGVASGFDAQALTAQATAPLKADACCQLEVMGLLNRRTQAYMQVPTRLAHCRTPQDVINEQLAFWRTAAEQYTESSRKIGETWSHAFPWAKAYAVRPAVRAERDYISFNGTGKDNSITVSKPDSAGKQRRVA